MKKLLELLKNLIWIILGKLFPKYVNTLCERIQWLEIGLSGNVSDIDKGVAKEKNLKTLNKFEKWLSKEAVNLIKKERKENWRQTCIKELGEDPEEEYDQLFLDEEFDRLCDFGESNEPK